MRGTYPIYTVETECRDCYKCVRHCPVKAIKVWNDHASVVPELCIACGHCVEICPAHAKKVRDDSPVAEKLIRSGIPVYVSLAPSWINEFAGLSPARIIAALKRLGFAGVSETALGAQMVSAAVGNMLKQGQNGALISSACPVVVDYICKYQAEFVSAISGLLSPALAHAKLLRQVCGQDVAVVFIGPCIAKKNEADRHPELINAALTFNELQEWLKRENINLNEIASDDACGFFPETAREGAVYPTGGGMNKTLQLIPELENIVFSDFDGLENLKLALDNLKPEEIETAVFIEALACRGGCVHGPGVQHKSPGLIEHLRVINKFCGNMKPSENKYELDISDNPAAEKITNGEVKFRDLQEALRSIGKTRPEDELNCGGCGYDSCRGFAAALVCEKAEPSMCVSFMRKTAQKKANALLRTIPSGVVIVDRELELIECNRRFAEILGESIVRIFDAKPGMNGADLKRLVPFCELFRNCLNSGKDICRNSFRMDNKLLNITVFSIEAGEVAGAVIADVTNTELRREQIANRAGEVINKNLLTVQEIACRLGEHMAETEILLRSISEEYADDKLLDDIRREFSRKELKND